MILQYCSRLSCPQLGLSLSSERTFSEFMNRCGPTKGFSKRGEMGMGCHLSYAFSFQENSGARCGGICRK